VKVPGDAEGSLELRLVFPSGPLSGTVTGTEKVEVQSKEKK